eukprot:7542403-Alexandrium_andersonii.AAC.1
MRLVDPLGLPPWRVLKSVPLRGLRLLCMGRRAKGTLRRAAPDVLSTRSGAYQATASGSPSAIACLTLFMS